MTSHCCVIRRAGLTSAALMVALMLPLGCSEKAPLEATTAPTPAASAPSAGTSVDAAALVDSSVEADLLIVAANAALAQDRMFSPPGDNALELLLQIVAKDPAHRRARAGLADILPFVMIGLEQRLATGDLAEVERLLGLFRTADPAHPALGRLQSQLDAASEQRLQDEARSVAALAESERLRALTQAAPVQPTPAPARPIEQPSVTAAPPPEPPKGDTAPSAPPVTVPVASPPTPVTAPAALPPILAQFAPRYPAQAQRRRLEGVVEVEFTVASNGSVSGVRVVRSEPAGVFDREAVGAMQRWRFQGTGQAVVGRRVFDFKLGDS